MLEQLTKKNLKTIIFEAFKDVPKGDGLGARECLALDDYATEEALAQAKALDTERHWWEYPEELVKSGTLDYALTYNNKAGVKFHLPALMIAALDEFGETAEISVFFTLCLTNFNKKPHRYHRAYVAFMKSIDVSKIIAYYDFSAAQIHAIAQFFLFDMHKDESYYFFDQRDAMIAKIKREHDRSEQYEKSSGKGSYTLTLKDAIAIQDEEHRIICDWFKAGDVNEHVKP